ncbi:MAG: hypothetical protein MRZ79_23950 [Bacteroidia bacterium]|nr:hypothetical protein [Bacteroidia bacterium]
MLEFITQTFAQVDLHDFLQVIEAPESKWGWYVLLFSISFVKFFIAAAMALAEPSLNFWEFFLSVGGGALVSVVVYTYFGDQIRRRIVKLFNKKKQEKQARDPDNPKGVYKVWHRYGLIGVSMLAPFLSPMICVGVAVSFKEDPRRIIFYNGLSIIIWTIIFALLRDQLLAFVDALGLLK